MLLSRYLSNREAQWRIRVVPEQRVQITPSRFRVPDICVVNRDAPIEQIFTRPPVLCVEILSPEDRMSEMQERIDDYLGLGVPCVWLLDPRTRRAWISTAGGMQEVRDGILRVPDLPVEAPLAELFD
jgi:Uma2 family endonuclease